MSVLIDQLAEAGGAYGQAVRLPAHRRGRIWPWPLLHCAVAQVWSHLVALWRPLLVVRGHALLLGWLRATSWSSWALSSAWASLYGRGGMSLAGMRQATTSLR